MKSLLSLISPYVRWLEKEHEAYEHLLRLLGGLEEIEGAIAPKAVGSNNKPQGKWAAYAGMSQAQVSQELSRRSFAALQRHRQHGKAAAAKAEPLIEEGNDATE